MLSRANKMKLRMKGGVYGP